MRERASSFPLSSSGLTPISTMLGVARDHGVGPEVPPEVIRQLLRSAILLPAAFDLECLWVQYEDAARPVALIVAERVDVDAVGTIAGHLTFAQGVLTPSASFQASSVLTNSSSFVASIVITSCGCSFGLSIARFILDALQSADAT